MTQGRIRRLVTRGRLKWAATLLSVLIVLIFIASVRCSLSVSLRSPRHRLVIVGVYRGAVGVTWFQRPTPARDHTWTFRYYAEPDAHMRWWPRSDVKAGWYGWISVPIWILLAPPLWIGIQSWRRDLGIGPYGCRECGYDLRGITIDVCPECGTPTARKA